jgi:hypothetical protein
MKTMELGICTTFVGPLIGKGARSSCFSIKVRLAINAM